MIFSPAWVASYSELMVSLYVELNTEWLATYSLIRVEYVAKHHHDADPRLGSGVHVFNT